MKKLIMIVILMFMFNALCYGETAYEQYQRRYPLQKQIVDSEVKRIHEQKIAVLEVEKLWLLKNAESSKIMLNNYNSNRATLINESKIKT